MITSCSCCFCFLALRIGGLAIKGEATLRSSWGPTFETWLNEYFAGANNFTLVPLDFTTAYTEVEAGTIDFLYTNPSMFACMEAEFDVVSIASQNNLRQGYELYEFGGVIFTRTERDDITVLEDLEGKIIEAVSISGLGAAQMQWKLMIDRGMSFFTDPKQVRLAFNQKKIVHDVINGDVDVGFVRTDLLEDMNSAGDINSTDIKVIEPRNITGFPFQSTTQLYPEWNFASLPHVDPSVRKEVALALYSINSTSYPALAGSYANWLPPLNYYSLHVLGQVLGLRDPDTQYCHRSASDIYDAIYCENGFYKMSKSEFDVSCNAAGLDCPTDYDCFCRPCVLITSDEDDDYLIYLWISIPIVGAIIVGLTGILIYQKVQSHRRQEEFRIAQHRFEAASQARRTFLTFICHEIRNPLNGQIGVVSMMENSELTEKQAHCLRILSHCNQSIVNIINDTVDIVHLQNASPTNELVVFDFKDMLGLVCDVYQASTFPSGRKDIVLDAPFRSTDLSHTHTDSLESSRFSSRSKLSGNSSHTDREAELLQNLEDHITGHNGAMHIELDPSIPAFVLGDLRRIRQVIYTVANSMVSYEGVKAVTINAALGTKRDVPKLSGSAVVEVNPANAPNATVDAEGYVSILISVTDASGIYVPPQKTHLLEMSTNEVLTDQLSGHQQTHFSRKCGLGIIRTKAILKHLGSQLHFETTEAGSSFFFTIRVKPARIPEAELDLNESCATHSFSDVISSPEQHSSLISPGWRNRKLAKSLRHRIRPISSLRASPRRLGTSPLVSLSRYHEPGRKVLPELIPPSADTLEMPIPQITNSVNSLERIETPDPIAMVEETDQRRVTIPPSDLQPVERSGISSNKEKEQQQNQSEDLDEDTDGRDVAQLSKERKHQKKSRKKRKPKKGKPKPVFLNANGQQLHLLLTEDEFINQKILKHLLTKEGFLVDIACNGRECVDMVEADPDKYSLILMDIEMPVMNGIDAMLHLRTVTGFLRPIIAVTANTLPTQQLEYLEGGANAVHPKPLNVEALKTDIVTLYLEFQEHEAKEEKQIKVEVELERTEKAEVAQEQTSLHQQEQPLPHGADRLSRLISHDQIPAEDVA